jgi:hypothetical protein
VNRFLTWNHETLAKFANDLFNEHLSLKQQVVKCTCGVVPVVLSTPPENGDPVLTVQDKDPVAW